MIAAETGMLGGLAGSTDAARRWSWWAAVASGLSAVALSACGGSQPPARAYGSTELEQIRDSSLFLSGQYDGNLLVYGTGGVGQVPVTWWTLDLATGALQSYGLNMPPPYSPPTTTPPPPPPPSLYSCKNNLYDPSDLPGTFTLEITDTTTNVETDIHDVSPTINSCPDAAGNLTVFVADASGGVVLEAGPYTQLQPVELTIAVLAVISYYNGLGSVLAAPVTAPDQHELDLLDFTTFAVTVLVPGVPVSPAWATGATPVGSLQSTSVADIVSRLYDHYFYTRSMSDGGTTVFVGPITSGPASELALFEVPPGTVLPQAARLGIPTGSQTSFPKHAVLSWRYDGDAGAPGSIVVWDDTDLALTSCPTVSGVTLQDVWASDESGVLFVPQQTSQDATPSSGPLDLLTLGGPGGTRCQQLVGADVVAAGFSPDAQFMFWLVEPSGAAEAQLWIAAPDGTGAHMIGTGEISEAHFIGDGGARLEMILDGELAWLDLHDPTAALHHVAEQVHGSIYDITGGHWLIMGYQQNATDGTVTLALINRDNSQVRPISPSVTSYLVIPQDLGPDGGIVDPFSDAGVSVEFEVVYVVRGRNPSPQDGIWRATITEADLQ